MAIRINDPLRTKMVDAVTANLGSSGVLKVYAGTQPGTGGATTSETMIVQFESLAWATGSNGTAALLSTKTGTAATNGTAAWARLASTDGSSYVIDGNCGTSAASDFVIDAANISAEAVCTLTKATIIQPGS
jgi:hypothetical protein